MGRLSVWNEAMDREVPRQHTHTVAVMTCGRCSSAEDGDFLTLRKTGYKGWSLYYCEKGRVEFGDIVLNPGEVWIYEPGAEQRYAMYQKDKTVYHYLHFNGSDIRNMFTSLDIPSQSPIKISKKGILELFEQLESEFMNDDPFSTLCSEYLVLLLFTYISRRDPKRSERKAMKIVTDKMEHSFAKEYDVKTYADMLYISVDRFQHLFKEHMGVSPYAYYIKLRMENAVRLLTETDMKIKEIAEYCGYRDLLYFSQAFKKERGVTPSVYRKMYRSDSNR